jgi:hypothetical protein
MITAQSNRDTSQGSPFSILNVYSTPTSRTALGNALLSTTNRSMQLSSIRKTSKRPHGRIGSSSMLSLLRKKSSFKSTQLE